MNSATARPITTPRPIVGDHLYQECKSWGGGEQVMKLSFSCETYEVFRRNSCDDSDSSSPVFKNGQYYLSWHVATMLLSDGYYSILPYGEGWSAQFTDRQIHLLFSALKKLEGKVPWGAFVRQMNNFRVLNEDEKIPFSERLAQIYSPQEEWIGVY